MQHGPSPPAPSEPFCFQLFDAVLVFLFDASWRFLIVRHRERGWELPGGKRNPGECVFATAARELKEESGGIVVPMDHFRPLASYAIQTVGDDTSVAPAVSLKDHVKLVFVAQLPPDSSDHVSRDFSLETDAVQWVDTSELWECDSDHFEKQFKPSDITLRELLSASSDFRLCADSHVLKQSPVLPQSDLKSRISPLLHDCVFPLCLQLSLLSFPEFAFTPVLQCLPASSAQPASAASKDSP